jgi:hypothetical protein
VSCFLLDSINGFFSEIFIVMAPPVDIQLPLVAEVSKPISSVPSTDPSQFNPSRHLAYQTPSKILKMGDIALEASPISSVAATEPFPLLSREAVLQHRREIFSEDVLSNCMHYTRPGSVQIRGMAPRYAPFIHQFWHSPEILKIISENAGVDLVPAMDYEICHTNVQLGPAGLEGVKATPVEPPEATETAIQQFEQAKPKKEATSQEKPIIEWHKDSHPFVCVVMLSDARFMEGGETELQCGDGTTLKVKAPQMVRVYLLETAVFSHNIYAGLCDNLARSLYHTHSCADREYARTRYHCDIVPTTKSDTVG